MVGSIYKLIQIMLIAMVIGSIYGVLHDQFTYTICPAYYTEFKFYQFGFFHHNHPIQLQHPRLWVSMVGLLSTWWFGLLIGFVIGIEDLLYTSQTYTIRLSLKAIGINLTIAIITGLIGLFYGKFILQEAPTYWEIPHAVVDVKQFIAVGTMHNFSYVGGGIGLVVAFFYKHKQLQKIQHVFKK